jgi:hypothetical protein
VIVGSRRLCTALGVLVIAAAMASAHWLTPDEIVAGLANDRQLRDTVGVVSVRHDRTLPRLLIVSVRCELWERVPEADRIKLAEEWLDTWRHSVPEGVVAILDAATQHSVVNFDGLGHARLTAPSPTTPRSEEGSPQHRGHGEDQR